MRVSIAMATYNGERFLLKQLESIDNQDIKPDELVISDDNSTDKTTDIILDFSARTKIQVVNNKNAKNCGYTKNFSHALEKTTGDIVFLSDQDDVWFPNKISTVLKLIEENPRKSLFINEVMLTDANLVSTGYTKLDLLKRDGGGINQHGMGCAVAVRRELLDFILPIPDGIHGHDNWLNMIAEILGVRLYSPVVLQYYRRHENTTSKINYNKTSIKHYERLLQYLSQEKRRKFLSNCNYQHLQAEKIGVLLERSFADVGQISKSGNLKKYLAEYRFRKYVWKYCLTSKYPLISYSFFVIYYHLFYGNCSQFHERSSVAAVKDLISFYIWSHEK